MPSRGSSSLATPHRGAWALRCKLRAAGRYIQDKISEHDVKELGLEIGSCKGQAIVEALAIAVAMRAWLPRWATFRAAVAVRSDSTAALGALGKLASPNPAINKIAREVSLDVAFSRYGVDVWEHLPGVDNKIADVLSRAFEPGVTFVLPTELRAAQRTRVEARTGSWWQAQSWRL